MGLFLSFFTLALTGAVIASSLELGMASNLKKRDVNVNVQCNDSKEGPYLTDSLTDALQLANLASDWLKDHDNTDQVFVDYFGAGQNDSIRQQVVYESILTFTVGLICSDPSNKCGTVKFAYVEQAHTDVYFCTDFFDLFDNTGLCRGVSIDERISRAAIVIVELVLGETSNVDGTNVSDCSSARDLASKDPSTAASNPDSYSCFAMQVYVNTQCKT